MEGMKARKYLHTSRKRFDPIAIALGVIGLIAVLAVAGGLNGGIKSLYDLKSFVVVVVGSVASLLFQFDLMASWTSLKVVLASMLGTPDRKLVKAMLELDRAVITDQNLSDLREGKHLGGDLLNDVVYMQRRGLTFEEIDEFVTARVRDEYLEREIAVNYLNRAAIVAPALGLFGTVLGLIEVLKTLATPQAIGPAMSLALLTTAYGAGLGSLVFTPLAGRLEHHNHIFLEVHRQFLSKVSILLKREERRLGGGNSSGGQQPEGVAA